MIRYLYIDDELPEEVNGIVRNLSTRPNDLAIDHKRAIGWNEQVEYIKAYQNDWDGILMDLKLELPISENISDRLVYGASALAQEIRSLTKKGDLVDKPIILCSTDDNYMTYFDKTGNDLFDACLKKNEIVTTSKVDLFIFHAVAYQKIIADENNLDLLLQQLNTEFIKDVKPYFEKLKTVHEKASFIYNQIVQPIGLLIDEDTLAIRLGINKVNSADWTTIAEHIQEFKYTGVYSEITNRWWMPSLNKWWKNTFPNVSIQNTSSAKKVDLLKAFFHLENLTVITKPEYQQYDLYWHKCLKSSLPTATADSIRCLEEPHYSWQSPQYISLNYAWNSTLRQQNELRKMFASTELEKFEKIILERNNR